MNREEFLKKVKSKLKPGDIVVTGKQQNEGSPGFVDRLYERVSDKVLGKDNKHATMYVGKGKFVDTNAPTGVTYRGLAEVLTERKDFKILTPKVSTARKKQAVAYVKDRIGEGYSYSKLFGTLWQKGLSNRVPSFLNSNEGHICSGLIGEAYKGTDIVGKKTPGVMNPSDFGRGNKGLDLKYKATLGENSFKLVKAALLRKLWNINVTR